MSAFKFTKEQQDVIDARNCNLLVSAAAGSGKTAVLVERLMGLITDPQNPSSLDRMLVMTFTRAAAEGMRNKIQDALTERVSELSGSDRPDEKLISHLKTQLSLLPRARISTIDSICQGLVRQYFQNIDVDPAFRAADEEELKLIRKDIIRKLLEEKYEEGDPEFVHLSESFTKTGLDEKISSLVERLYAFAEAKPWPERFLGSFRDDAILEIDGKVAESGWFKELLAGVRSECRKRKETAERLLTANSEPDGWTPYISQLEFYRDLFESILSAFDYDGMRDALGGVSVPRISTKGCREGSAVKKAAARKFHDDSKKYVEKLKSQVFVCSFEEIEFSSKGAAGDVVTLTDLTLSFMERFTEKKRAQGIVDFNDMEHLALQLLYEDDLSFTPLADELSLGFDQIMIDEYQDSNEVQEALIMALSAERFGRPDVFMVGDVKQSIYMFRQAEPRLFMEKYRTYETYDENSPAVNKKIELNRNFRSTREVINSINDIFYKIMLPEVGGIRYDENAALYAGRGDQQERTVEENSPLKTELLLLDTSDKDADCNGLTDTELEYRMIAERIKELIAEGWHKKEITVLMRNAKTADLLCRILTEKGIDAYFDAGSGYFDSVEVSVMLSFLSIVDNIRQDIPLAAVLRSPAAGFTDDELAMLRFKYGAVENDELPDLYDCLYKASLDDCGELSGKASSFLGMIESFRALSGNVPVHELIYRIFRETGYYDYVLSLPGGKRRRRNLDLLLQKAEDYSAGSYHGLFNFMRYIEQLKKYETDYGEAPSVSENDDTVLITTIHKSKGLEYPVTIVAEMGKGFNQSDQRESLMMDGSYGIACDYYDIEHRLQYPSLKKELIKESKKNESMGEELRVLYVALTRAEEKLIMTGQISGEKDMDGEVTPGSIEKAASELSLILLGGAGNSESIAVRTYPKEKFAAVDEIPSENPKAKGQEGKNENPEEFLPYPYIEETLLKPKVSVSELKAKVIMEEDFQFVYDLEERKEVKGAEFGTLVHRAFETLDYSLPADSCVPDIPGADAKTMESVRKIINRFRETPLGCIMCEAAEKGTLRREQHFMVGFPACELTPGTDSEELQLLQGIIDAYILGDDGVILVDYKTDHVDDGETLVKRYALQLELYKKALMQLLRKPVVKCLIYSTHLNRTIEV